MTPYELMGALPIRMGHAVLVLSTVVCGSVVSNAASAAPPFTRITSGFGFETNIRPALADNGTVVAAQTTQLQVGDGGPVTIIDLAPSDLELVAGAMGARAVQVRSEGEVVFVANRTDVVACDPMPARGVYQTDTLGSPETTLFEACVAGFGEKVGPHVSLSGGGTVAFSTIVNGDGAVYRGPLGGPVSVLRSGSGIFFNTREVVVNDFGQTAVQMEYTDPMAGLTRGVFIFETPEQTLAATDTAYERSTVQPFISLNSNGIVALSTNNDFTIMIGGEAFNFTAGVYRSDPTLFATEKMLTQIADMSGNYCGFGHVDINDSDEVVFEAQVVDGLSGCEGVFAGSWDGIYRGGNPVADAVVTFGDEALEGHQFYDSVYLGELNENSEVSFLTTYSEPLVEPNIVWRTDLDDINNNPFDKFVRRILRLIRRILSLFGFPR